MTEDRRYSKEWQRTQLLKQNAVRIKFGDLNPAIQTLVGRNGLLGLVHAILTGGESARESYTSIPLNNLSNQRVMRGQWDLYAGISAVGTLVTAAKGRKFPTASMGTALAVSGFMRGVTARFIQQKHAEIAETAKKFGLLQTQNEKQYPPDWINPTIVAQTHPIFSVTRKGDIIFRRVTPLEFKLLKAQEGWRGKAGLNISGDPRKLIWRWRGTLRKSLAPEVERRRVWERLRQRAARWNPLPAPTRKPVFAPARRPTRPIRRR